MCNNLAKTDLIFLLIRCADVSKSTIIIVFFIVLFSIVQIPKLEILLHILTASFINYIYLINSELPDRCHSF